MRKCSIYFVRRYINKGDIKKVFIRVNLDKHCCGLLIMPNLRFAIGDDQPLSIHLLCGVFYLALYWSLMRYQYHFYYVMWLDVNHVTMNTTQRKCMDTVLLTTLCIIWNFRNTKTFNVCLITLLHNISLGF